MAKTTHKAKAKRGRIDRISRYDAGVMIVKDGKAWGLIWGDEKISKAFGWVDLFQGTIYRPEFVKEPVDVLTPYSSDREQLADAKVVRVKFTKTLELIHDKEQTEIDPDRLCPFVFKSESCGYSGGESACDKTLICCQNLANDRHFGGYRHSSSEGKRRYPPDGYYNGLPCTCKPECSRICKGFYCACQACHDAYMDFLSGE